MPSQKEPAKCDPRLLRDLVQTSLLGIFFVALFALNGAWYFWSAVVFAVYCFRCNSLASAVLKQGVIYAAAVGGVLWLLSCLGKWWQLHSVWLFVGVVLSFFVRASSEGMVPWGQKLQAQMRRLFGDVESKIVAYLQSMCSSLECGLQGASKKEGTSKLTAKKTSSPQKKRATSSKSRGSSGSRKVRKDGPA